jgi:RNA polymerase Rpb4
MQASALNATPNKKISFPIHRLHFSSGTNAFTRPGPNTRQYTRTSIEKKFVKSILEALSGNRKIKMNKFLSAQHSFFPSTLFHHNCDSLTGSILLTFTVYVNMKVKNARAAELSDFEVLQVLREMGKRQQMAVLKNDELAAAAAAIASSNKAEESVGSTKLNAEIAKDSESIGSTKVTTINSIKPGGTESLSIEERTMQSLPSNLRTIQYEVLECLRNVQRPCAHQSADQIPRFMDALYAWERGKPVEGIVGLNEGGEEGGIITFIEREKRLTKGERLMLINHAPTTEIELYPVSSRMCTLI